MYINNLTNVIILIICIFVLIIPFIRYCWGIIKNIFTSKKKPIRTFYPDKTYYIKLEKSEQK